MFTHFYTTAKGSEYLARSMLGKTLVITAGKFGNGALPSGSDLTSLTDLVSPLGPLVISKKTAAGNMLKVTTQFSNKIGGSIMAPFHLMEIGLFGKLTNADGTDDPSSPETLILYTNALTQAKADYIPDVLTEFIINWPMTISSTQDVTVVIDESLAYPTLADFNASVAHKVVAGGTASAIAVSLGDMSLVDGLMLQLKLTSDMVDGATLSLNGGASYPIKTMDGEPIKDGAVAGSYLPLTYNAATETWYVTGGGSSNFGGVFIQDTEPEENNCFWFKPYVKEVVTPAFTLILSDDLENAKFFAEIDGDTKAIENAVENESDLTSDKVQIQIN